MASVFRQTYTKTLPDGSRVTKHTKKWYAEYVDSHGVRHRVPGYTDRAATQQLAARLEREAAREAEGLTDPTKPHRVRQLVEHLADYASVLEAKGDTPGHVKESVARVRSLLDGCGFARLADVDPGKAAGWLHARRRDARPVELPAGRDSFTPAEVAALLNVSGSAVRSAVKRHGLAATGEGKARRLPRATVLVLCDRTGRGNGPQTVNHYLRSVRGFFRWLVDAKRIASNPLDTLSLVNAQTDVRRGRREMTADELRCVLAATLASLRAFRGLTGRDRFHLYLTAATTGFRARALANLTPGDFDLDAATPTVTLPARFNKSGRAKVQPLPAETAAHLRTYFVGRPASSPIWGGTWARDKRGAEMLRGDLEAVGIPYSVEGPDGPEFADFHSLRHSYLTLGGRSGSTCGRSKSWPGTASRNSPPGIRTSGCTTSPGRWRNSRP